MSCYAADEDCHECKACVRRWVALAANGIMLPWRPPDAAFAYVMSRPHEGKDAVRALANWNKEQ